MAINTAQWKVFLTAPDGENSVPELWKTYQNELTKKSGISFPHLPFPPPNELKNLRHYKWMRPY